MKNLVNEIWTKQSSKILIFHFCGFWSWFVRGDSVTGLWLRVVQCETNTLVMGCILETCNSPKIANYILWSYMGMCSFLVTIAGVSYDSCDWMQQWHVQHATESFGHSIWDYNSWPRKFLWDLLDMEWIWGF